MFRYAGYHLNDIRKHKLKLREDAQFVYTYGPEAWIAASKFLDEQEKLAIVQWDKLRVLYG